MSNKRSGGALPFMNKDNYVIRMRAGDAGMELLPAKIPDIPKSEMMRLRKLSAFQADIAKLRRTGEILSEEVISYAYIPKEDGASVKNITSNPLDVEAVSKLIMRDKKDKMAPVIMIKSPTETSRNLAMRKEPKLKVSSILYCEPRLKYEASNPKDVYSSGLKRTGEELVAYSHEDAKSKYQGHPKWDVFEDKGLQAGSAFPQMGGNAWKAIGLNSGKPRALRRMAVVSDASGTFKVERNTVRSYNDLPASVAEALEKMYDKKTKKDYEWGAKEAVKGFQKTLDGAVKGVIDDHLKESFKKYLEDTKKARSESKRQFEEALLGKTYRLKW